MRYVFLDKLIPEPPDFTPTEILSIVSHKRVHSRKGKLTKVVIDDTLYVPDRNVILIQCVTARDHALVAKFGGRFFTCRGGFRDDATWLSTFPELNDQI